MFRVYIPYHVTYLMINVMLPNPQLPNEQTHACENITFPHNYRCGRYKGIYC